MVFLLGALGAAYLAYWVGVDSNMMMLGAAVAGGGLAYLMKNVIKLLFVALVVAVALGAYLYL